MSPDRDGTHDLTIGVIGDGFGALMVYTTAVYLGFEPEVSIAEGLRRLEESLNGKAAITPRGSSS